MNRLGFAILLATAGSAPAVAETLIRPYEAVMHVASSNGMPVLDDADHVVGIGAFRGLALFADGEVAVHRYEGWFDFVNGAGPFHGYAAWRFDDGSELRAAYRGVALEATAVGVEVEARLYDVTGTGRFAGASGDGTFSGRRLEPIADGGSTHLQGRLTLTLPD